MSSKSQVPVCHPASTSKLKWPWGDALHFIWSHVRGQHPRFSLNPWVLPNAFPCPCCAPRGGRQSAAPGLRPWPRSRAPLARRPPPSPPLTPAKALENPFSVPTPLPRRKVGSGLYCPSGTGVSVCGEEMTTWGAQGKSDVRLPRGQERTATICSPALASLSALGERRLRPTLSALLPPPGHSRPSLGVRGQERPLSPGYGLSTSEGGRLAALLRSPHLCPWELRLSDPRARGGDRPARAAGDPRRGASEAVWVGEG